MSAYDMAATMDALAAKADAAGVARNIYAYPEESLSVPCVVVGYPTEVEFDLTMGRGSDRAVHPVFFLTGKASAKAARDTLSDILTGATGIKDALDGPLTVGANTASVRVTDCKVEEVTVGSVAYIGATFNVEVIT